MNKEIKLFLAVCAMSLTGTGCVAVSGYCENHGAVCATVGSLGAAVAVGCAMMAVSSTGRAQ